MRVVPCVVLRIGCQCNRGEVEATGEDLLEKSSTFHTDVDRGLFDKIPLESQSSSLSSLVTLATPGIAADSNGLFHGLGDHAENSFSVDGQPITDQQSKVFSNQIPVDSIESMEVIAGAPPAEFGEKTSVVINVTTRSGQGQTTPKGSVTASYGSFGTSNIGFTLGYGGEKWGNFLGRGAEDFGTIQAYKRDDSPLAMAMARALNAGLRVKCSRVILAQPVRNHVRRKQI